MEADPYIIIKKHTYSRDEIEKVLQSLADKFSAEINSLNMRINELKTNMETLKNRPPAMQSSAVQTTQEPAKEQFVQETHTEEKKPAAAKNNPRSGNYGSEDVAIDKFFYFGGGKR